MPKELFNQGTPAESLDDQDRFAFGQPGVAGAKNILWSAFKRILSAGLSFIGLGDTPESYEGQEGKKVIVNAEGDGVEFAPSTTSSGFYDPDGIVMTFDGTTLVLTGTNKFVTSSGDEFEKTNDSIVITPVNGTMYVYYDDAGNLQQLNNPNRSTQFDTMQVTLPVAYLIYNLSDAKFPFVGNYLKGRTGSRIWVKNFYDHEVSTLTGLAVFGLTGGSGSVDADVQLGLSAGELIFADMHYIVPVRVASAAWNVGRFDSSLDHTCSFAAPYLVITDVDLGIDTTGRALYNNDGNPLPAGSGDFVWYFVLQTLHVDDTQRTTAFMGNSQYSTVGVAEDSLSNEVATLEGRLGVRQGASIKYAVLIETKSTFANATKSRIEEVITVVKDGSAGTPSVSLPTELIDGTDASSLHNHDSRYASTQYQDLAVVADVINLSYVINLDWNNRKNLTSINTTPLEVTSNATVTYSNTTNAVFTEFEVNVGENITLTFPVNTISGDDRMSALVLTLGAAGIYSISIKKIGTTYKLNADQNPAI